MIKPIRPPKHPKLKKTYSELQKFVVQLESIASKREDLIAKYEAENVFLKLRVKSLQSEMKQQPDTTVDSEKLSKAAEEFLGRLRKRRDE